MNMSCWAGFREPGSAEPNISKMTYLKTNVFHKRKPDLGHRHPRSFIGRLGVGAGLGGLGK